MPTENKAPDKPNELAERESKPAKSEYGKAKTASVIFNVFFAIVVLQFLQPLIDIDKEIAQMARDGKDIAVQLQLLTKTVYAFASACLILPALLIRFIVMGKSIRKNLDLFEPALYIVSSIVLMIFLEMRAKPLIFVLWVLTFMFTLHILSYDKGGLFRTFFANIWYKVKSVFKKNKSA